MAICNSEQLTSVWSRVAVEVSAQREELNELDRVAGDGDHGENLDRGLRAVVQLLKEEPPHDVSGALSRVGETIMEEVAGSAGFLLGSGLMKAGQALASVNQLDANSVRAALRAAIEVIARRGKSAPGDKTMLDALVPAEQAAGELDDTASAAAALSTAAQAARAGAAATAAMLATKGRASYVAERGIGTKDPGATSVALMLRTIAAVVNDD